MYRYTCMECGKHVYTDTICVWVRCACGEKMVAKRMKVVNNEDKK